MKNSLLPDLNLVPENDSWSHFFLDESLEDSVEDEFIEDLWDAQPDEDDEERSLDKGYRMLKNEERLAVLQALLQKSVNGRLTKGIKGMVANQFSTSWHSVHRIWKQYKDTGNICHRKTGKCGRKRIQIVGEAIREIPLQKRRNVRALSCASGISKSTLHRRVKSGEIRRHSSTIKPMLNEVNKRTRLSFCLSMLDPLSIPHDPIFKGMYNIVHIDEKWFYMTKKKETYYMLPDEEIPHRTCQSTSFIRKVMFMAAVARPRVDVDGCVVFSGKIGIFPFATEELAKRSSCNREAGTLETKAMTTVNRNTIRLFMIEQLLPAIKAKWPGTDSRLPIYIQQDNARTHIKPDDEEFCKAAAEGGYDIRLFNQPPNSPDMNVLDLGFFNSIQTLQHQEAPTTVDQLIGAVVKAFEEYPINKCNHIFLTLQSCMRRTMLVQGSNRYEIKHFGKEKLERDGKLPCQLNVDPFLVQMVINHLAADTLQI